jgi:restriction system protein
MERARHLDALLAVSPTEFEQTIAVLLSASGCVDVTRAGGPGDLTADITCRDANGRYLIVQCKQYSPNQKVGSVAMQQFIGMGHVHHGAERMVYVTTADFTKPARDLAAQHHIELVDGSVLVEWAKRSAGWTSVASLAPKTQTERIDLPHRDNL